MPYTPAETLPCVTMHAIPTGSLSHFKPSLVNATLDIYGRKNQDLNGTFGRSHSLLVRVVNSGSAEKSKSKLSTKRDSDRENALKQVKDILSTSPQLSTSPRRKSAPDVYSRRPLLKVDLPQILDDLPCILRKKSGEIVKSSLKKGKSEPTTPTFPKYVHFNTDLEQIKLFDEAQRPQAVSAEISEAESDDDFDLTSDTDDEEERVLTINIVNMPPMTTERCSKSVFVESIFLSKDKRELRGRIQVQNLAFEKIVNIRYTFDSWQSVSEASASYAEKVHNRNSANNFDVFTFSIELIDNSRNSIDGKTLYFAVHYSVNGCDYWDNNGGQNYQVNFKRISPASSASSSSSSGSGKKSQPPFSSKWSQQHQKAFESCSPPSLNMSKLIAKKSSRYDISSSLHAAQSAHRPVSSSTTAKNSYFSPAISYGNDHYSSFFPVNYVDGMPGTTESPISVASSWEDSKGINFQPLKSSTPIAIPSKPAIGSTPYYDLANQYYFYQGSPYGAGSPYASSPPVMT